jgi:hypothetical protein
MAPFSRIGIAFYPFYNRVTFVMPLVSLFYINRLNNILDKFALTLPTLIDRVIFLRLAPFFLRQVGLYLLFVR